MSKERVSERKQQRVTLQRRGSLYVHESLKSGEFHYRWVNRDDDQPYKLIEKLELGYTPVENANLEDLKEKYGSLLSNAKSEGNYITRPINKSVTAILMKIPRERYEDIVKANEERVRDLERQMKAESRKEGFYGDFKIGQDEQ